jgi:glycogen synthase
LKGRVVLSIQATSLGKMGFLSPGSSSIQFGRGLEPFKPFSEFSTSVANLKKEADQATLSREQIAFVSIESPEDHKGGLGVVSGSIPAGVNRHTQSAMSLIIPMTRKMLAQNHEAQPGSYVLTDLKIPYQGANGQQTFFSVYTKYDEKTKTRTYALSHPDYIGAHDNIYAIKNLTPRAGFSFVASHQQDLPPEKQLSPTVETCIAFNAAVAKLLMYLNPKTPLPAGVSHFPQLPAPLKGVLLNDWHTGGVPAFMPKENRQGLTFNAIMHNAYDGVIDNEDLIKALKLPEDSLEKDEAGKPFYSGLSNLMRHSGVIFTDANYSKTLVRQYQGSGWPTRLKNKIKQSLNWFIHHDPGPSHSPIQSDALKGTLDKIKLTPFVMPPPLTPTGFEKALYQTGKLLTGLKWLRNSGWWLIDLAEKRHVGNVLPALEQFKTLHKQAMQHMLGLNTHKESILMTWAARMDFDQKGLLMLTDNLKTFLLKPGNEAVQMIFSGNITAYQAQPGQIDRYSAYWEAFRKDIESSPELKGRVAFFIGPTDQGLVLKQHGLTINGFLSRLYAATDLVLMPSTFEPYGLTQTESGRYGAVTVANDVDGITSSIYDPAILKQTDYRVLRGEKITRPADIYGQTGFLMRPKTNPLDYRAMTQSVIWGEAYGQPVSSLSTEEQAVRQEYNQAFKTALTRAVQAAKHHKLLGIGLNTMNYMQAEPLHQMPKIVKRYVESFRP